MSPFIINTPVREPFIILAVPVQGEHGCVPRLISIGCIPQAVFIFHTAVFVSDAGIKIVQPAALDGIIKSDGSHAGLTYPVEIGKFISQIITHDVVTDSHAQAIGQDRNRIIGTPVEHLAAGSSDARVQMIPFVGQIGKIIIDTILVIPHGAAAIVISRCQTVFCLVWIDIEQDMNRSRFTALAERYLGVCISQIRQEPDGPFQFGPGNVITLFQEPNLPLYGCVVDFRMIFNSYPVKPSHLHDIGHSPLVYLLLRQISPCDKIAMVTKIFREYISPALQLGKSEVFSLIVRQQCLQRLFGIDILPGNLEFPDGKGDLFSLNSR